MMRASRVAFAVPALVAIACGLDAVGTATLGTPDVRDASITTDSARPTEDATVDVNNASPPSHVPVSYDPNAPNLSGVTAIDTSMRTVQGAGVPGLRFEDNGGIAVLYVGSWTVDVGVRVTGTAPLVVVAAGEVIVDALLDASAELRSAGPGGFGPASGPGAGAAAVPNGADDPGGGGAGFGAVGGRGGRGLSVQGGDGGAVYGALLSDFVGGSGGGHGSPYNVVNCMNGAGSGGGGGGAFQISSALRIRIGASGAIASGGGGGRGGCVNGSASMSGGGGGSGGMIFLEAPVIEIAGTLAANGGGGGGGAALDLGVAGMDGRNGTTTLAPARGGGGAYPQQEGGVGGTRLNVAEQPDASFSNAGGGGGAVGRIWLRTSGAPATIEGTAVVTPAPSLNTSL